MPVKFSALDKTFKTISNVLIINDDNLAFNTKMGASRWNTTGTPTYTANFALLHHMHFSIGLCLRSEPVDRLLKSCEANGGNTPIIDVEDEQFKIISINIRVKSLRTYAQITLIGLQSRYVYTFILPANNKKEENLLIHLFASPEEYEEIKGLYSPYNWFAIPTLYNEFRINSEEYAEYLLLYTDGTKCPSIIDAYNKWLSFRPQGSYAVEKAWRPAQ